MPCEETQYPEAKLSIGAGRQTVILQRTDSEDRVEAVIEYTRMRGTQDRGEVVGPGYLGIYKRNATRRLCGCCVVVCGALSL